MASKKQKRIRYAVVGQGWFAQQAILPAFQNATENSELVALVSGDEVKRQELSEYYEVPAYPYEEYNALLKSGSIDAVFIALPNSHHADYTIRAARAGIHVLTEKPMADSTDAAARMVQAAADGNVRLMVAYRLHFEEANLKAIEIAQSGQLGEVRMFNSTFTQTVQEGNSRLEEELGGGPLWDIGIYCINAARYLFQDDPVEVMALSATEGETRFSEVPEQVGVVMRFPKDRLATFHCGFGEAKVDELRLVGTQGNLRIENAYGFHGEKVHYLTIGDEKPKETTFKDRDHIGPEIVYFSNCILEGRNPEPDGQEGFIDTHIIEAIHQSIRDGSPILVGPFEPKPRPSMAQEMRKPRVKAPELVKVAAPSEPQP